MTKFLIFSLFVAMAVLVVVSTPARADPVGDRLPQPRVICDLLGMGDSACAARCIVQGKKGGYCEKGVCHCR